MHKLKLYCNALILILFFLCLSGCTPEPIETDLLLPVDFSNVPENMVLTHFSTDKIEIRIRAYPKLMELINKKNIVERKPVLNIVFIECLAKLSSLFCKLLWHLPFLN